MTSAICQAYKINNLLIPYNSKCIFFWLTAVCVCGWVRVYRSLCVCVCIQHCIYQRNNQPTAHALALSLARSHCLALACVLSLALSLTSAHTYTHTYTYLYEYIATLIIRVCIHVYVILMFRDYMCMYVNILQYNRIQVHMYISLLILLVPLLPRGLLHTCVHEFSFCTHR